MDNFLLFDGAMGTQLQARGLKAGELPELINLMHGEIVRSIHEDYVKAGADVITTNTFGANSRKLKSAEKVQEVIKAAIKLAREAGAKKVALDIGPTGALLKPMGLMTFDEAYELFKEQVIAGADADLIVIETMSDLLEIKAAVLAAKENSDLPVFATMTFGADGRTFLGTTPKAAAITLSALGVDAVGINCSLGPRELKPLVEEMLEYSTVPVMVQPNASLPEIVNGETVYKVKPLEFAALVGELVDMGVSIVGGCCGTSPEHIRALRDELSKRTPVSRDIVRRTAFTGTQNAVIVDNNVAVIGERINPTGKKLLKEALRSGDMDYILNEAISQGEAGAEILDVNAGLPELDEVKTLEKLIGEIQAVSPLPLQIDSSDPKAIERAVRVYCGKPIINSVNGKEESLTAILPIVKKYGAAVVGLTLDEDGIPETAEKRFEIAEKILKRAESLGIPKEDVLIDCLVLSASTSQVLVKETLRAVRLVSEKLGCKTVLGVSNVSFGLPNREILNSTYLAAALNAGLNLPILNPLSEKYMEVVNSFRVLSGEDTSAEKFISIYANTPKASAPVKTEDNYDITSLVLSGRKLFIEDAVRKYLETEDPLDIINNRLIPAINAAGDKFEKGEFFLPQLMSSAETIKLGFDVIRARAETGVIASKGKILLATVKGDIHDIGKNIVKMLLQNYGYEIIDLGRDVDPELVAETAAAQNIKLVGLSALMTTTVKSMQDTITVIRNSGSDALVMVGGAVLTEEYAKMVGADFYVRDAAESARIAKKVLG